MATLKTDDHENTMLVCINSMNYVEVKKNTLTKIIKNNNEIVNKVSYPYYMKVLVKINELGIIPINIWTIFS